MPQRRRPGYNSSVSTPDVTGGEWWIWAIVMARRQQDTANGSAPAAGAPARAWQRMLSGRRLNLLDPSPLDIEIEDIAHGLSRLARWNGQTAGDWAFTVAQHSLLVESIFGRYRANASDRWRLAALLHDAPEYVIGDLITPFKAVMGVDYRTFEDRLQRAIHVRFGLPPVLSPRLATAIKRADRAAAHVEARQLARFDEDETIKFFGKLGAIGKVEISPWPPARAKSQFLERFTALTGAGSTPR